MKKKVGNHYPKYKAQPDYEQNLQRWINEYKDIDDDENIAYYFEDLSIDTYNNYIPELESCYTESE